ncbi:MAG: M12 family metallopeptidase [Bacteriovoracaceae bacterium]
MKNLKIFIYLSILYIGYVLYLAKYKSPNVSQTKENQITHQKSLTGPSTLKKVIPLKNKIKPVEKKLEIKKRTSSQVESKKNTSEIRLMKLTEEFAPMTEKGDLTFSHVFVDGQNVMVHGDILIADLDTFYDKRMDEGPFVLPKPRLWPNGIIPYELATDLNAREAVILAIEYFNKNTPIKFVKRKSEEDYLYFKNGINNCYSYLGFQGKKQEIVLNKFCRKSDVLHEIMHTLGFYHEQNRVSRDKYLEVNWKNIDEKHHLNFKKIHPKGMIDPEEEFDFDSILLYGPYSFALVDGEHTMIKPNGELYEVNRRGVLSAGDLKRIKKYYKPSQKIE